MDGNAKKLEGGELEGRIPRRNSVGDGRGGREIIARWRAAISGCAVNTKDSRSPAPSLGSPHLPDNATNTHINQIHTQMYNPEIHTKQFKGKPGTHQQQQQLDMPADVSATIKKNLKITICL